MTRQDAPGPLRRRGPRPLWLHLTGAPTQPATVLPAMPPMMPPGIDPALLAGIAAYRRHPYQRDLVDPPAIWAEGDSRLLDYGRRGDPAVMFVPSLVNRAYVLDLLPERSMMRWFAARRVRPLLLDWGWPGAIERGFDLTGLIAGRLERALLSLRRPVVLAGYCMGGLLALTLALRQPKFIRALALLATPWDFHAEHGPAAIELGAGLAKTEPLLQATGTLPIDVLQMLFASVDPGSIAAKYRAFAQLDPASTAARDFVALEDWLNDGVPLAAPIARDVFSGWYRDNLPAQGHWKIGGEPVMPQALRCPAFMAVPSRDRIVPPGSALALGEQIQGATIHRPQAGHIGMAAGPRAEAALWQPLLDWLRGL